MTKHIAPLPDPDGSLLLRELNHGVNNELTSAICTVSAKAVSSLGGRVHASCAAEGSSFLVTFPLTEFEQHTAGATHVVLKRRKVRRSQRLQVPRAEDAEPLKFLKLR